MTSDRFYIQTVRALLSLAAIIVVVGTVQVAFAQSNDQSLPTAVLTTEIDGTIPALDVGDSRLTRHYYAFEATPGDLIITVNSRNLNGDVDVFTAVTFRPLTKISIYANTIPPEVTKSLYFRAPQILILRVEARTPDDDPGSYRITFGGTFKPFAGGIAVAENSESSSETSTAGRRNPRRLSSVGATLPQPPEEIRPEEPKPTETVAEAPKEEPEPKKPAPKPRATRATPRPSARNRPVRTPRSKPDEKPKTEKPAEDTGETTQTETKKEETKPAEGEEKTREAPEPKPVVQEPVGPHLIIEQRDGTRIDRPMSTIRRVTVERGLIMVVLKNGRIERFPMSDVARMAIEP